MRKTKFDEYEYVSAFFGQAAIVIHQGKWFHVDFMGTPLYDQRYDYVSHFTGNKGKTAFVCDGKDIYKIDYKGNKVE